MISQELPKDNVILYSYYTSSAAWRVRAALNVKGIKYEYVPIDFAKEEQRSPEYENINPLKRVPALAIDGDLLVESLPIIEYLEETRPEKKLFPADPKLRQKVRMICEVCNSDIHPYQNRMVREKIEREYKQDPKAWAVYFNVEGFKALEKIVSKTAGKYSVGDEITAADCFILPQVYGSSKKYDIELTDYPTLQKIVKNLLEIKEFSDALPENQPDYPQKQAS